MIFLLKLLVIRVLKIIFLDHSFLKQIVVLVTVFLALAVDELSEVESVTSDDEEDEENKQNDKKEEKSREAVAEVNRPNIPKTLR